VGEVAGEFGKRGDEEVAEVVAFKGVAGAESVGEELGEDILLFAEGDHAVTEVAGGKHVEVLAQSAGRAAVIGHGDDSGEVGDLGGLGAGLAGRAYMTAQAAQQGGQAGAAADGHHAQGGCGGGDAIVHGRWFQRG
jgi:hypothetical protein